MDEDGLPIVGAAVDLTKVAPIDSKRILAFINHFICHTMNFLNKFSVVCENKLEDVNVRIQRIETSLSILESKLASIPGLDDISLTSTVPVEGNASNAAQESVSEVSLPSPQLAPNEISQTTQVSEEIVIDENVKQSTPKLTVAQDERYAKYLKMVQVGVPIMALRPKMLAEGLDPDLLSNPNAEVSSVVVEKKISPPDSDNSSSSNNSENEDFSD